MTELETLHHRLQKGREELLKLDSEQSLLKREIEISRNNLKESCALNEIEHKNLTTIRERISILKHEQTDLESQLVQSRDNLLKQEHTLRTTKALSAEQLRLLELDLSKLQQDFKTKQRLIEELTQKQNLLEEEGEIRIREIQNSQLAITREVEEEHRKLSSMKNEARLIKLEIDQLQTKKKGFEKELEGLEEDIRSQTNYRDKELYELTRKIEFSEKQYHSSQLIAKQLKDTIYQSEREVEELKLSIDRLKQENTDLERNNELKKKTYSHELSEIHAQLSAATKKVRHLTALHEAKQNEYDQLLSNYRGQERKIEEITQTVKQLDLKRESLDTSLSLLTREREKVEESLLVFRKEKEEIRGQIERAKLSSEQDTKLSEELRNTMQALKDEVRELSSTENRLQTSLSSLYTTIQAENSQLGAIRSQIDRDKRVLYELQQKKQLAENELNHCQSELLQLKEYQSLEKHQTTDRSYQLTRLNEEIHEKEKKIQELERRIYGFIQKEAELKEKEESWKFLQINLKKELSELSERKLIEISTVDRLKEEVRELEAAQEKENQSLRQLRDSLQATLLEKEKLSLTNQTLRKEKEMIEREVSSLRNFEEERTTQVSQLQRQIEEMVDRSNSLQTQCKRWEIECQEMATKREDERKKLEREKRLLEKTMVEAQEVEQAMKDINLQYQERSHQVMKEIGQLESLKSNTQSQFLLLNQAKERMEKAVIPTKVEATAWRHQNSAAGPLFASHRHSAASSSSSNIAAQSLHSSLPFTQTQVKHHSPPALSLSSHVMPQRHLAVQQIEAMDDNASQTSSNASEIVVEMSSLQKAVDSLRKQSSAAIKTNSSQK